MKTHYVGLLFVLATLVCAVPASAQVMQATVKIDGMI